MTILTIQFSIQLVQYCGICEDRPARTAELRRQTRPHLKNPERRPMDRKIRRTGRVWRFRAAQLLTAAALTLVLSDQTFAQRRGRGGPRGGFDPQTMFTRFDQDGNGRIDADEIDSNPFIPRLLGDIDTSRGLTQEEFQEAYERARQNRFGGRGEGNDGEGRRRRGWDRDGESREFRDGGSRDRSDSRERGDGESGDDPRSGDSGDSSTNEGPSRTRITIDLQSEFLPGDRDRDGQIGFYEWRRFAGRSMREFQELDRNQDGFVTPREVALARPDLQPAATTAATARTTTETTVNPAVRPAAPALASATQTDSQPQPVDDQTRRDADRFLRMLDKNRDGQIAPDEWEGDRIRTMFTNDGIDLGQPISDDDFTRHYIRLSTQQN